MKREFSVIELACIVKEMQVLVGARINKVLQYSDKWLAFECFKTGIGRVFMNICRPGLFWFGQNKFSSGDFGFHKNLARFVDGARVSKIVLVGSERIVKIDLSTADKQLVLYVELFNKGEIVLCNSDGKILCLWETQLWQDRQLKIGAQYSLPKKLINIFVLSINDFRDCISVVNESISKTIATELGIGGVYANELCVVSGIDKSKKSLTLEEISVLHANLFYFFGRKVDARVVYENSIIKDIVPFPLKMYENFAQKSFSSYCEAVDDVLSAAEINDVSSKILSQFESRRKKLNNIIEVQKLHLSAVQKSAGDEQRKGELIYENYQKLKTLLDKISAQKISFREIKAKAKEFGLNDFDDVKGDAVVEV